MFEGEGGYNPEEEKYKDFTKLRKEVNDEIDQETSKRIQTNPKPTEEEITIGAFREMLEPQVREAIFEFSRKGYPSESSGFYGIYGEKQAIDGMFEIDPETTKKIEALGAKVINTPNVRGYNECKIEFYPASTDPAEMKKMWGQIADILPSKENLQPSISGESTIFRKQYAPERTDIEQQELERILVLSEFEPTYEQEMRKRLEELKKGS